MIKRFLSFILENASFKENHVVSFVRMNPVHEGHREVVDAVTDEAKKQNASHSIVLSQTHDAAKNPLTPQQKLKHAKIAFPGANVETATKESPTLLHHLSHLHDKGVRNITVVGGSDRDTFNDLAKQYNGVKGRHGYYKFDSIKFKQAGAERSDSAEGKASYSASKMREAAKSNDRKSFHAMAPANMTPAQKDDMMNDVQKGMKK